MKQTESSAHLELTFQREKKDNKQYTQYTSKLYSMLEDSTWYGGEIKEPTVDWACWSGAGCNVSSMGKEGRLSAKT